MSVILDIDSLEGLADYFNIAEHRIKFQEFWQKDDTFRHDFRSKLKRFLDDAELHVNATNYFFIACARFVLGNVPVRYYVVPKPRYMFFVYTFTDIGNPLSNAMDALSMYLFDLLKIKPKIIDIEPKLMKISFISKKSADCITYDILERYGYDEPITKELLYSDTMALMIAFESEFGTYNERIITAEEFFSNIVIKSDEYEVISENINPDGTYETKLKIKILDIYDYTFTLIFSPDKKVDGANIDNILAKFRVFDDKVFYSVNISDNASLIDNRMVYTYRKNADGKIEKDLLMFFEMNGNVYVPIKTMIDLKEYNENLYKQMFNKKFAVGMEQFLKETS